MIAIKEWRYYIVWRVKKWWKNIRNTNLVRSGQ